MLTSTPSRSHRSTARTTVITLVVLVILGVLLTTGYLVLHTTGHPRATAATATTAAAVTSAAASLTPTPAPSALPAGVIRFVALPVGIPPSPGRSETGYPWHRLTATLTGPARVSAGTTPDFRVRLTNRTSASISLDPCPAYDLRVGLSDSSYGLNCADAATGSIPAGGSLTFDLPVPIASGLSGSRTKISWSLGWSPDRASPSAHTSITVS